MLTVSISINGNPIYTRTAVNVSNNEGGIVKAAGQPDMYRVDDGQVVRHNPKEGAVALAHLLLDTIHEVK